MTILIIIHILTIGPCTDFCRNPAHAVSTSRPRREGGPSRRQRAAVRQKMPDYRQKVLEEINVSATFKRSSKAMKGRGLFTYMLVEVKLGCSTLLVLLVAFSRGVPQWVNLLGSKSRGLS